MAQSMDFIPSHSPNVDPIPDDNLDPLLTTQTHSSVLTKVSQDKDLEKHTISSSQLNSLDRDDPVEIEPQAKRIKTESPPAGDASVQDNAEGVDIVNPHELALYKLCQQIEFYFGEANYPRDRWMNLTASENNGYIPLSSLPNFPRVAKLLEGQSANILVESIERSHILEFDDSKTKVKRKEPLPDVVDLDDRSAFVSKLPQDSETVTVDSVKSFFNALVPTISVRLHKQRSDKSKISGTAYVTFKTIEDKDKVLALNNLLWKGDIQLKIVDKKQADIAYQEKRKKVREERAKREGKCVSEDDPAADSANPLSTNEPNWQHGLIIKLDSLSEAADVSIDELKHTFATFGTVKFVDIVGANKNKKDDPSQEETVPLTTTVDTQMKYMTPCDDDIGVSSDGTVNANDDIENNDATTSAAIVSNTAYIRFADSESASKALVALNEQQLAIKGTQLQGCILADEEEKQYWLTNIINKIKNTNNHQSGGRKGTRGGNSFNRRSRHR